MTNPKPQLNHFQMLYHLREKVNEYIVLRDLTKAIVFDSVRGIINKVLIGWLYEIIITIKICDFIGYEEAGFDLTNRELETMKSFRHMTFHIPDNNKKYFLRSFLIWLWADKIVGRMDHMDRALSKYMKDQLQFKNLVDEQASKDTMNSQELLKMAENYLKEEIPDANLEELHKSVKEFNKRHE